WIDFRIKRMRELAQFIRLNAFENAHQQHYKQAFQQIGYIDQLAARIANGDILMGFLVARSIQGIGIKATYTMLQDAQLTKQQAQTYSRLLPHSDWHQLFYDNKI